MLYFDLSSVNWVAVIVAAVINMVIGFVWYSKALFAEKWTKLVGKNMTDLQGGASIGYAGTMLASLVTAFVLAWFINALGATGYYQGALVGLLAGVGFVVTSSASNYLFEGRPKDLFLINVGYTVVSLVVMGAVVASL